MEKTMKGLRERFGRPLRLALIGGGPASWIGRMHQTAAELDGYWRVVAGVFSSDPARSRDAGAQLGFDPARSYGELRELLDKEKVRKRSEEHTSELQSQSNLVCRLLLAKKK